MLASKLVVIKIGSNVLTLPDGNPDLARMEILVAQVQQLKTQGKKVAIVSSGAVAFGRQKCPLTKKLNPILKKQIWAATGQISLIHTYQELFARHQIQCAQLLVTKEDFRDRKHFLNMKNCVEALLDQGIIPIINENDTVTITELMFTDNDELAGLTAAMVNADTLMLLTNVDGIFTGDPKSSDAELIRLVNEDTPSIKDHISASKSSFGRGGMLTKYAMAKKSANLGIQVLIVNGKNDQVLSVLAGAAIPHTYFAPKAKKDGIKKWLAHGEDYYRGKIKVNAGAKKSLTASVIRSLLPVGILEIDGQFSKGDILLVLDEQERSIGLGRAEYGSSLAKERIGQPQHKPLIHYDYLYLFDHD